jgi:hypothetical protein
MGYFPQQGGALHRPGPKVTCLPWRFGCLHMESATEPSRVQIEFEFDFEETPCSADTLPPLESAFDKKDAPIVGCAFMRSP